MKLLLADDHSLFREALVQYIERAEPDAEVLLARDVHEVMEIMEANSNPDLILLDLRMPGMNGLQGMKKLRDQYPDTPVALMSGLAEKDDVECALEMGAAGYFPKTLSGKALIAGIRQILEGGRFIAMDHNTNELMPSYYGGYAGERKDEIVQDNKGPGGPVHLTPREKEVLDLLMRGESNKEIARTLELQVVTVKLHVRGICRKLNAKNRTQAVLIAQKKGL